MGGSFRKFTLSRKILDESFPTPFKTFQMIWGHVYIPTSPTNHFLSQSLSSSIPVNLSQASHSLSPLPLIILKNYLKALPFQTLAQFILRIVLTVDPSGPSLPSKTTCSFPLRPLPYFSILFHLSSSALMPFLAIPGPLWLL